MKFTKLLFAIIALAVLIVACTQDQSPNANQAGENSSNANMNSETAATPMDELAQGKKHYVDNCARCHKEDGTGGPVEIEGEELKPDDLTSEKMKKEPDEEYMEYMKDGIPDEGMPSFKDVLSEDEMKMVIKYIREELQK